MDNNYSLSDIASVAKDNGLGGDALILILLFVMLGGGFWNKGNGNAVEQSDIQRAIDLNSIQNGQAEIMADIQRTNYEQIGATKDSAYNNLSEIRDIQSSIGLGFANQQKCCCETLRAIDGVNYNGAINTASINENTTAQVQRVLDRMYEDRIHLLEGRVNELQLQSAMCGVVRYPLAMTYTAENPFCKCPTTTTTTTASA